jgi:hypothetical protein
MIIFYIDIRNHHWIRDVYRKKNGVTPFLHSNFKKYVLNNKNDHFYIDIRNQHWIRDVYRKKTGSRRLHLQFYKIKASPGIVCVLNNKNDHFYFGIRNHHWIRHVYGGEKKRGHAVYISKCIKYRRAPRNRLCVCVK